MGSRPGWLCRVWIRLGVKLAVKRGVSTGIRIDSRFRIWVALGLERFPYAMLM
jgi:hypothetical protein